MIPYIVGCIITFSLFRAYNYFQKEDGIKVDLYLALMFSVFSWIGLVFVLIAVVLYYISDVLDGSKMNEWFKESKQNEKE